MNNLKKLKYKKMKNIKYILIIFSFILTNNLQSQCGFQININKTDNACNQTNNGSATATVLGTQYEYLWLNSDSTIISTTTNISSLATGEYIVFVTDTVALCTQYKTIQIGSYYISEMKTKNVSCPTCDDGKAELFFTNGISPFVYQWDDEYLQTTRKATDLIEGTYNLELQDSSNCILNSIADINDCGKNIKANFIANTVSCFSCNDASLQIIVSGGTSPYIYQWDDDLNQTSDIANNLVLHRNYSVVVTDDLACQTTFFVDSTEFCKSSIFPTTSYFIEPTCYTCTDGQIAVSVVGIHAPFSYFWEINSSTFDTLTGEAPGIYNLRITDTVGCVLNYKADDRFCFGNINLFFDNLNVLNEYMFSSSVSANDVIDTLVEETYIVSQQAENGIVNMQENGSFTYKPFHSFSGVDVFFWNDGTN